MNKSVHLTLLSLFLPISAEASEGTRREESVQSSPRETAQLRAEKRSEASEHYRQGRFAEALAAYRAALGLEASEDTAARAILHFNIGSCFFELSQYKSAEREFLRAAELDPQLSTDAHLHAGFAMLQSGALVLARKHLTAAEAGEPKGELNDLTTELRKGIEEEEARRKEARLIAIWKEADTALRAKDNARAKRLYGEALRHQELLTAQEKAYFHRGLAVVALREGNPEEEEKQLTLAYSLDPDPRDLLDRGYARLAQNKRAAADADFAALQKLDSKLYESGGGRNTREGLRPLQVEGVGGWLSLGAGYDTNAVQSGSADTIGVATVQTDTGSPVISTSIGLGNTWRPSVQSELTPRYMGQVFVLTDADVSEQSLQEHQAGVRYGYAPNLDSRFRMEVATSGTWVGWSNLEPFTFEGILRFDWRRSLFRSSAQEMTRLDVGAELRPIVGLGDFDYMNGARADVQIALARIDGPWEINGLARLRYYGIGSIDYEITADQVFHCEGENESCAVLEESSATYSVPLGYLAPTVGGELHRNWGAKWQWDLRISTEYRRYLEESFVSGDTFGAVYEPSLKRRQDLRTRAGTSVRYFFGTEQRLSLIGGYGFLSSISNMARETPRQSTTTEPEENLDYDNRNFTQHTVELRAEWIF